MKEMTKEQLRTMIDRHEIWLDGGVSGRQACFKDCDLRGMDLSDSNLQNVNFTGADLRGANLTRADLRNSKLVKVKLAGACLNDINLQSAKFSVAKEDAENAEQ